MRIELGWLTLQNKMKNRTATQTPVADGRWNIGSKGDILKIRKGKEILQSLGIQAIR
jgi:hypothetical protein